MKFTIEIPDELYNEVLTAVAARRGYTAEIQERDPDTGTVSNKPNPLTLEDALTDATLQFWGDEATARRLDTRPAITPVKLERAPKV